MIYSLIEMVLLSDADGIWGLSILLTPIFYCALLGLMYVLTRAGRCCEELEVVCLGVEGRTLQLMAYDGQRFSRPMAGHLRLFRPNLL